MTENRREQIAAARSQAAGQQRLSRIEVRMAVPVVAMALLLPAAWVLSIAWPSLFPAAHPGVLSLWGALVVLFWVVRGAVTS